MALEAPLMVYKKISPFDINFALFMFFSTHLAYLFQHFFGYNASIKSFDLPRHLFYKVYKPKLPFIISISSFLAFLFTLKCGINVMIILIPITIISALYNIKVGSFLGLRHIPYLKTFLIAFVWAYSLSFPYYLNYPDFPLVYIFLRNFLFILAVTIPFDLRDLNRDPSWLKTIPQILNENDTRVMCIILLILHFIISWMFHTTGFYLGGDFLLFAIGAIMINVSRPDQDDKLYLIGLDGLLILKFVFVYTQLLIQ
jgi:hypothetical protein